MKRWIYLIYILILLISSSACSIQSRQDKVLDSLGKYESEQIWTHGAFQDYTDFGVYSYASAKLENNKYFRAVSVSDIDTICAFVDNFEECIDTFRMNDADDKLVVNYSFDRTIIDTADYFYIYESENDSKFSCYDVWFFDSQTKKLYYFHNNI